MTRSNELCLITCLLRKKTLFDGFILLFFFKEIKVIADLLAAKYGPSFAEACRVESIETISPKLKHKLSIQAPAKLLVEKYVIEIAKSYNIPYEPDPQVMEMEKGILHSEKCLFSKYIQYFFRK